MADGTDLDEYLSAVSNLKQRMEEYGTVASALQNAASILLKSHRTSEASSKALVEFASLARVELEELRSSVDSSLQAIQNLNLGSLYETMSSRYDEHQSRLAETEKVVREAVTEQRRLGMESLQSANAFQSELSRFSQSFSSFATDSENVRQEFRALISDSLSESANRTQSSLEKLDSNLEGRLTAIDGKMRLLSMGVGAAVLLGVLALLVAILGT